MSTTQQWIIVYGKQQYSDTPHKSYWDGASRWSEDISIAARFDDKKAALLECGRIVSELGHTCYVTTAPAKILPLEKLYRVKLEIDILVFSQEKDVVVTAKKHVAEEIKRNNERLVSLEEITDVTHLKKDELASLPWRPVSLKNLPELSCSQIVNAQKRQ